MTYCRIHEANFHRKWRMLSSGFDSKNLPQECHAHLDDPGRAEWERFPSGTKAAAVGGITTLIDMPLNSFPSTMSEETLKLKIEAAEDNIYVDVGFWGGLVPENAFNESVLEGFLSSGVLGLKVL